MEHYFTNNQNLKSEIRKIPFSYNGYEFTFLSDNGVFAKNKIDYASKLLVDNFLKFHQDAKEKKVLDVGCGYGFIGVVIGKITNNFVDMIDVNKRAIHLADENINLNKVNGKVFLSDTYENVDDKYDYIITNPPIRAGKKVVLKILKNAKDYLNKDGELWFVINKDHGAKSIKKEIDECLNIECIDKSKGFYVFQAKSVDK